MSYPAPLLRRQPRLRTIAFRVAATAGLASVCVFSRIGLG